MHFHSYSNSSVCCYYIFNYSCGYTKLQMYRSCSILLLMFHNQFKSTARFSLSRSSVCSFASSAWFQYITSRKRLQYIFVIIFTFFKFEQSSFPCTSNHTIMAIIYVQICADMIAITVNQCRILALLVKRWNRD